MTGWRKRQVMEMALEAGFSEKDAMFRVAFVANKNNLERFAELVRADERNRTWTPENWGEYERDIAAQEREQIAQWYDTEGQALMRHEVPDAIRAIGDKHD